VNIQIINELCRGGRVTLSIFHCRKPTIGALQGSAVGVGITMTLPMNIRIAYAGAKIGFVFARRGLVMEAASSYFLPRLVGHSRAMQAITTGAVYPASDKIWDGLFSEVLDKAEDVLPRALAVAEEVAKNTSVVSTYLMKEMMFRDAGTPEGQHLLDSRVIYELFGSRYVDALGLLLQEGHADVRQGQHRGRSVIFGKAAGKVCGDYEQHKRDRLSMVGTH
jgi:enoyl-CoA hydratase/carnithine racemase